MTRGNSQTKNLALAFTADRKTMHDKLSLYTNSIYATNDAPGATPATTANAMQGGARYDHDLTPRLFAYVGADFPDRCFADSGSAVRVRRRLGWHAIKNDRTTLDLLGGFNYTREKYAGLDLAEGLPRISWARNSLTSWGMNTSAHREALHLSEPESRLASIARLFNFGTVTKISKWLGWQNAFGDIYVTNPPAGAKQNDILLTTGLNFSFTH